MMFDAINRFADTMANTVEKFKGVRESAEGKTEEIDQCIKTFKKDVKQARTHKLKAQDKSIQEIYDASTKVLKDTLDGLTKELEEARSGMQFIQDNENSLNVVVFGKVKAGKSYLGNLMMGNAIRKLPTKTSYDRLEQPKVKVYDQGTCTTQDKLKEVTEENDASGGFGVNNREATRVIQLFHLGAMTWVDTPGFGSLTEENQELAREYVKNADLVIFASNSDAAGTQQDFQEMKELYDMGKRFLLVLTQSDTLDEDCDDYGNIKPILVPKSDDDRRSTENYMKETLKKHGIKLGDENILTISAFLGLTALEKGEEARFESSNMGKFWNLLSDITEQEGTILSKKAFGDRVNTALQSLQDKLEDAEKKLLDGNASREQKERDMKKKAALTIRDAKDECSQKVASLIQEKSKEVEETKEPFSAADLKQILSKVVYETVMDACKKQFDAMAQMAKLSGYQEKLKLDSIGDLAMRQEKISYTRTRVIEVERNPRGIRENIGSRIFHKTYYRAKTIGETKEETIDLGVNVQEIQAKAHSSLEKILEKQAPQLIQEIIDYYSAPLREMQDEAFDAIQTAEKELEQLKC
mgnify:FL=1